MSRCKAYEGCKGTGAMGSSEDSGSGWQVYCTCDAGRELQHRESGYGPTNDYASGYDAGKRDGIAEERKRCVEVCRKMAAASTSGKKQRKVIGECIDNIEADHKPSETYRAAIEEAALLLDEEAKTARGQLPTLLAKGDREGYAMAMFEVDRVEKLAEKVRGLKP